MLYGSIIPIIISKDSGKTAMPLGGLFKPGPFSGFLKLFSRLLWYSFDAFTCDASSIAAQEKLELSHRKVREAAGLTSI